MSKARDQNVTLTQLRQYTTTGRVPGIGGDVGRNVFYGSETDWAKFLQSDRDPRHQHRLAAYGA